MGYNEGSKTPAEYKITDYLQAGQNSLSVEVYRWSDASYMEDQDFWRLSGIERDVYMYATNQVTIRDFKIIEYAHYILILAVDEIFHACRVVIYFFEYLLDLIQ